MAMAIHPDKIWVNGMVNDRLGQAGDQAAAVGGVNSGICLVGIIGTECSGPERTAQDVGFYDINISLDMFGRIDYTGDYISTVAGLNGGPANFVEFGAISFFPLLSAGDIGLNQINIISPGAK